MSDSELPLFVQFVSALGPTAVAASVAYVAWKQWETAKSKLRLDLFNQRFKAYSALRTIIGAAALHGEISREDFSKLVADLEGAEFLFGGELQELLESVKSMAFRAMLARQRYRNAPEHPFYERLIAEEEEVLSYLRDQRGRMERLFRSDLDLSKL